jgi:hypothetical protein
VLSLLVELLDKSVHSLHFLDSGSILLSGLLNSQSDFVLLEFVLVSLDHVFFLICDVFLLLNGEFVFSLLLDGGHSLVSVTPDEGNHGLEHVGCLCVVHIGIRYVK